MLKITVVKNTAGLRLIVEGKLAEPCVSELERAWNQARQEGGGRRIPVDLSEVTSVDPSGETVLAAMITEGARLTARGLFSGYIVEKLMRPVRKERVRQHGRDVARDVSSTNESSVVSQCSPKKER